VVSCEVVDHEPSEFSEPAKPAKKPSSLTAHEWEPYACARALAASHVTDSTGYKQVTLIIPREFRGEDKYHRHCDPQLQRKEMWGFTFKKKKRDVGPSPLGGRVAPHAIGRVSPTKRTRMG